MEETRTESGMKRKQRKKIVRDYDEDFRTYERLAAQGIPVTVSATWVSSFLGISKTCLCEWRQKGLGPKWYRLGTLIKYDFKDIIDYFQNGEGKPPKEFLPLY